MLRYFVLLLPLVVLTYTVKTDVSGNARSSTSVARLWSTSAQAKSDRGPMAATATPTPQGLDALLAKLDTVQAGRDRDKIAQVCDSILLVQPSNYRAQMILADLHFARQDYRKSAGDYARVLLDYPEDPAALSGAAWSAIKLGDHDRAINDLAALLQINPGYPRAKLGYEIATGVRTE